MRYSALLAAALMGFAAPAFAQNMALPVGGDYQATQPGVGYGWGGIVHDTPVYQGRSVAIDPAHAPALAHVARRVHHN